MWAVVDDITKDVFEFKSRAEADAFFAGCSTKHGMRVVEERPVDLTRPVRFIERT